MAEISCTKNNPSGKPWYLRDGYVINNYGIIDGV